jgi:hypothetical protein
VASWPPSSRVVKQTRALLADLAIVIGHHVVGVGVDADHAGDLNVDAGLLLDLASAGRCTS